MCFDKCIYLCNHPHDQPIKHFITLKFFPVYPLPAQLQETTDMLSMTMDKTVFF